MVIASSFFGVRLVEVPHGDAPMTIQSSGAAYTLFIREDMEQCRDTVESQVHEYL